MNKVRIYRIRYNIASNMATLFLLLGGNLGDKAKIFENVCQMLEKSIGEIVGKSSVYETEPWGFESDHLFWNQVLVIETELQPNEVLKSTKKIEDMIGRERKAHRYISRLIDIDLLFYNDLVLQSEELEIPHPRMIDRRFVLEPLAEIASSKIHPGFQKSISALLDECQDQLGVRKLIN